MRRENKKKMKKIPAELKSSTYLAVNGVPPANLS
jgi:hypothetical protein